jgi:ribosomal protein S18 acetylase RimI-like enzyme
VLVGWRSRNWSERASALQRARLAMWYSGAGMLIKRATTADYIAIVGALAEYWGERDMRAQHHPMFVHEFGDTALVLRDDSGGVAAYLFGFVAPTRVGYVHLVGVRADSRRAGLGRTLYGEFETLARQRGATTLKAITKPTNDGSIAFHTALGMTAEEVPDYSGTGHPRIAFSKGLSE